MAKFKVGDVLDRTSEIYSFWSKGGYAVYRDTDGRMAIKDDDGEPRDMEGSDYDQFFTARPSAPPEEDKALAWLKAKITARFDATDGSLWQDGYDAALRTVLAEVYSLKAKAVPQTLAFFPVT